MKEIFNKSTRNFSTVEKTFSDWDQIRDLVNDQLPKGIKKVEKVRGSETDKSYKVRMIYQSRGTKEIEVPITGKDALGNYNRATRSKVENTTRHEVSEENKEKYTVIRDAKEKRWNKEQVQLAKDASSNNLTTRVRVAARNNCPPEILEKLSNDRTGMVRSTVALHPNCPKEILEKLSKDDDVNVRRSVPQNPSTPKDVLERLSKDGDTYVRSEVAKNLNTPERVLLELIHDDDWDVRGAARDTLNVI